MKILVVSNLFPPDVVGGYEILCAQVAEGLAASGHDVTVLTSRGDRADVEYSESGALRVIRELKLTTPFGEVAQRSRLRRNRVGRWNAAVAVSRVREMQPDVVFVWSQLRLTVAVARACEELGVPVCYTMNDPHLAGFRARDFEFTMRSAAGAFLDRIVVPHDTADALNLDHVTCISHTVADSLVSEGVTLNASHVIHQGIPIERFPIKKDPGRIHDPVRLLYAGQVHDYKGPQYVLDALELLRRERSGVEVALTIAGEGPLRRELERRVRERDLPVRFMGAIGHDEMPTLYRAHDLFAFPSTWKEPFGLTHLEAMASGTPVISTVTGGQGEFLRDGVNALTVPPADAHALAVAIQRLIDDEELRRRLALEGRRTVESDFTLTRYVDQLDSWLQDARRGTMH